MFSETSKYTTNGMLALSWLKSYINCSYNGCCACKVDLVPTLQLILRVKYLAQILRLVYFNKNRPLVMMNNYEQSSYEYWQLISTPLSILHAR